MRKITLGTKTISDATEAYTIAEIGHNHQGDLEQALELIRAASAAGASAAKFQKRSNKTLFTPSAFDESYNSENAFGATYGQHREALEFGRTEYIACIAEAKKVGIDFFATAFDFESADFLNELGMTFFKIASGDLQNLPLLRHVAKFGKPMIISTGGANFQMIDDAVSEINKFHNEVAILQCTASYPAPFEQLNLRVIETLRDKYPDNVIGFSGHDNGIAMALASYALGARVIEKHFTLNRALKGTDHAFSLEPTGMRKMVRDLSRLSVALGDGQKKIYDNEVAPLRKMGKMIVAARDLAAGHLITEDDLEFRSPSAGLSPSKLDLVLGKKLGTAVKAYEAIQLENIE